MNWLNKKLKKTKINILKRKSIIPNNLWTKCDNCNTILYKIALEQNLFICPKCEFHMVISARTRLQSFFDKNTIKEIGKELEPKDILNFKDHKKYIDRLNQAQKNTNEKEALIVMKGLLYNALIIAAAFEFNFIGGSMSIIVGSKFVLAIEQAIINRCPLICFTASGGARMQEGLIALMQMAKTSAALARFKKYKLPYISVMTNPTMGEVSASLAILGDLNIAEPKAVIGFTGSRILENTYKKKLPFNFQRSEYLLSKGAIDLIIHRHELRIRIAKLLAKIMHQPIPIN